jgi:type II secretory pathway pseudopilin PulG
MELKLNNKGITLVELLLVIAMIGIMAVVLVNVIDVGRQQDIAKEASLRANLLKACAAMELYYESEDEQYPEQCNGAGCPTNRNPLHTNADDSDILRFYLARWPGDEFIYNHTSSPEAFSIHVKQSISDDFYKCNYDWKTVRECPSTMNEGDVDDC